MNYAIDTNGISTDSAQLASKYPECTNVSVGYYNEHSTNEYQDMGHLKKLAIACVNIDWEKLPVCRNPKDVEYLQDDYFGCWEVYENL